MTISINGIDLEIIDQTGTYDYEWSEFAVMRGDDGHLYIGHTGGCSCNYFDENLDEVTQVKSWQEAAEYAKRWAAGDLPDGGPYLEDEKRGAMDLIERLTKSQPPAFVTP